MHADETCTLSGLTIVSSSVNIHSRRCGLKVSPCVEVVSKCTAVREMSFEACSSHTTARNCVRKAMRCADCVHFLLISLRNCSSSAV